ncbi:MAG TPA: TolC family protein [Bacillota bacterium]|nr:TolC family protein [Bacillota bacterium]
MKRIFYLGLALLLTTFLFLSDLTMVQAADATQTTPQTLSLDQALELAQKNSAQLKAAAQSVKIAEDSLQEAKAGLLPTVGYSFAVNKNDPALMTGVKPAPPPTFLEPISVDQQYIGAVSANEVLYSGGKIQMGVKLAELKLASAREDERKAKQQLIFNVKDAYYRLWAAEKMFIMTQSSYQNMEDHYQQVDKLFRAGSASKFDLLRTQTQCESFKPQLIQAQSSLTLVRLSLASIIGMDPTQLFTVAVDPDQLKLPERVQLVEADLLNLAYQNRPEIRQIAQAAEMAKCSSELAAAGFKPTVNLSTKYSAMGTDFNLSQWTPQWTLTLSVSGNIYDGSATPARMANAKDNVELTALREQGLRDSIRFDIEQTCQNLQQSLDTIQANQSLIDLSKETLKLTQNRFDSGIATIMDIADAQLALDKTQGAYYQGIASYLSALAKLDLVTGKEVE